MSIPQDIVVIDSFAENPRKQDQLFGLIDYFRSLNKHVCLVSHLPFPERMFLPNVKHAIYDANNLLGTEPLMRYLKTNNVEIAWQAAETYHGPAVYINLQNALACLINKYSWVHFIEVDVEIESIQQHLETAFQPLQNESNVDLIAYPYSRNLPGASESGIQTTCFSCRPKIVHKLPAVSNWQEYLHHCPSEEMMLLEEMVWNLLSTTVNHRILEGRQIAHSSTRGGTYFVVKCPRGNGSYAGVVFNQSSRSIDILWSNGQTFNLEAGSGALSNITPKDHVVVTDIETQTRRHFGFDDMWPGSLTITGE